MNGWLADRSPRCLHRVTAPAYFCLHILSQRVLSIDLHMALLGVMCQLAFTRGMRLGGLVSAAAAEPAGHAFRFLPMSSVHPAVLPSRQAVSVGRWHDEWCVLVVERIDDSTGIVSSLLQLSPLPLRATHHAVLTRDLA